VVGSWIANRARPNAATQVVHCLYCEPTRFFYENTGKSAVFSLLRKHPFKTAPVCKVVRSVPALPQPASWPLSDGRKRLQVSYGCQWRRDGANLFEALLSPVGFGDIYNFRSMRRTFLLAIVISVASAAAFALLTSTKIGIGTDSQQVAYWLSAPGIVGITIAVLITSLIAGNPHGGGDPRVIALVSVLFNAPLCWLVLSAAVGIWKRAVPHRSKLD
jgi:hypothetical protein